jgi:beta-glucanase (GH16 family)
VTRPKHLPLTAATLALACVSALAACSGSETDDGGAGEQTVTATLLPPIAQPGGEPADPDEARPLVSASFGKDSAGREVSLESRSGNAWRELDSAEVGADGTIDFVLDDGDAAYRVVADASADLPAATSDVVETGSWGEMVFGETFDGDGLGDGWAHRGEEYNPDGLRRCSKGSPDAVDVASGVASLQVVDDPERTDLCEALSGGGKSLGKFHYRLNGHIASNAAFTYGVTAARIKFQREKGQHGSFWLQSNSGGPYATNPQEHGAEVDVVEYFGDSQDDRLASFIYYPTEDGAVKEGDWIEDARDFLADKDDEWWNSFHVFSVEWTQHEYVFRIDGREAWRTSDGVSGQPQFIVLSLLSSDYELPNLPDGGLPQEMQVDWVRHWEPAAG